MFRGHVRRRAFDGAGLRLGAQQLGEAEVDDDDAAFAFGGVDEDVRRLEVAVQNSAGVQGGDAAGELHEGGAQLAVVLTDEGVEVDAVDELHRNPAAVAVLLEGVEAHEVLVRHVAERAELLLEAHELVGADVAEDLDGDAAAVGGVDGVVDGAEAALADDAGDAVAVVAGERDGGRRDGARATARKNGSSLPSSSTVSWRLLRSLMTGGSCGAHGGLSSTMMPAAMAWARSSSFKV